MCPKTSALDGEQDMQGRQGLARRSFRRCRKSPLSLMLTAATEQAPSVSSRASPGEGFQAAFSRRAQIVFLPQRLSSARSSPL